MSVELRLGWTTKSRLPVGAVRAPVRGRLAASAAALKRLSLQADDEMNSCVSGPTGVVAALR